ncbi:MAG: type I DNA topoisomerase, partial [Treponema sp.]|nr:type I DNA topoisomerase [Treponema sp.]
METKQAAAKKTPKAAEKASGTVKKAPPKKAPPKKAAKKTRTQKILVIVESPAKAATIEKYLGREYSVKASMGHLIDLPKSRIAIDVERNFEPEYITVRGRAKLLKEIQGEAKKSEEVLLASDNDREGEAIAWHLRRAISVKNQNLSIKRIAFNEITPQAIREAVDNPSVIDEYKVNAQKARRVLDRLVGYNLSPLLWKKVKNGLSAGRVQSVALRLICEREKEVESFIPEEYWSVEADFKTARGHFRAQLVSWQGKKPEIKSEEEVEALIAAIKDSVCVVSDIKETEKTVRPRPPFTTSQLQQTAANRLGFTSKKTMQVAQQLYEGVDTGQGRVGLISYMRTDSVRISQLALDEARDWIGKNYPADLPDAAIEYAVGKKAQDAHEAIRPTYVTYTPDSIKDSLTRDQYRLYTIIWERFVACQMKAARTKPVSVEITATAGNGDEGTFRIAGTSVIEKGFYQVLKLLAARDEKGNAVPQVKTGDTLGVEKFHPEQHFTQGPARYTDASIVKTLEELGIGRPSTYAPTISVLLDRYYVTRSNKQLVPTLLGRMISDMLGEYFPHVIDPAFTAAMENKLDEVEENKILWPD